MPLELALCQVKKEFWIACAAVPNETPEPSEVTKKETGNVDQKRGSPRCSQSMPSASAQGGSLVVWRWKASARPAVRARQRVANRALLTERLGARSGSNRAAFDRSPRPRPPRP